MSRRTTYLVLILRPIEATAWKELIEGLRRLQQRGGQHDETANSRG
jgi:hypothetical protein